MQMNAVSDVEQQASCAAALDGGPGCRQLVASDSHMPLPGARSARGAPRPGPGRRRGRSIVRTAGADRQK